MEKAIINMFMGMGVVFLVLILISLIITCFKIFPYIENKLAAKKNIQKGTETLDNTWEQADDQIFGDNVLVAVIMGAIANQENCNIQDFVVKSIKRR